MSFQGHAEDFSNVWTVDTALAESFNDVATINQIVAFEKALHTNHVSFIRASSYGIGGTDAGNVMREILDLTGLGTVSPGNDLYRECALRVTFELPRSLILRRKRTASKWFHLGAIPNVTGWSSGMASGATILTPGVQTWFTNLWNTHNMDDTLAGGGVLAVGGDPYGPPVVSPYMEHRQFKRGRKEGSGILP
jgi:hypothetical protein